MKSKLIMIVEDDLDIRRSLQELLESEGYEVCVAGNGQLALDSLRSARTLPALILLDLTMPVMDGFQFRQLLEQESELNTIPVLVMTADGQAQPDLAKMRSDGFLAKPVEIDHLLETVGRYF